MRLRLWFPVFLAWFFLVPSACTKKKPDRKKEGAAQAAHTPDAAPVPPAALAFHYRLPGHHLALKKAIEPLAGPSIQFIWPHVESVQALSAWIFELPRPEPGKFTPPRFVVCLRGKATEWLYAGTLIKPEGGAVTFEKGKIVPVRGVRGAHDTYYLLDEGQHACLGSAETLVRDAMKWPAPGMKADGFLKAQVDIALLAEMARREEFAPLLASMRALWSLYRIDPDQVGRLVADMQALDMEMGMSAEVDLRVRYELSWKNPPSFLKKPVAGRIPLTARSLLDFHFELDQGRWMGIDVWPLIEAQNPPNEGGFADKLKAFVQAVQGVDFQLAEGAGEQLAVRFVVTAPGQADFLFDMTRQVLEEFRKDETASVKAVSSQAGEEVWEVQPTAATDADVREFVNRYAGGKLAVSCRREGDAVVWTLGQWDAGAAPLPVPDANVRLSFSLLPFFNRFLPFVQARENAPEPRFVPYPSVERDPWTAFLTLHPERKAISAEGSMPLGAWLRGMQKHPEIIKYLQGSRKSEPPSKAKPASDL